MTKFGLRGSRLVGTTVALKNARGRKTGTLAATIAGLTQSGKTVEECELKLLRSVRRLAHQPQVIHYCGWTALLYPDPDCWQVRWIGGPDRAMDPDYPVQFVGSSSSLGDSYAESFSYLLLLMAQRAWTPELGRDLPGTPAMAAHVRYDLAHRSSQFQSGTLWDEWNSWTALQIRYHHATSVLGLNPTDAHSYAGCDPARQELWEQDTFQLPVSEEPQR